MLINSLCSTVFHQNASVGRGVITVSCLPSVIGKGIALLYTVGSCFYFLHYLAFMC